MTLTLTLTDMEIEVLKTGLDRYRSELLEDYGFDRDAQWEAVDFLEKLLDRIHTSG